MFIFEDFADGDFFTAHITNFDLKEPLTGFAVSFSWPNIRALVFTPCHALFFFVFIFLPWMDECALGHGGPPVHNFLFHVATFEKETGLHFALYF